jgi:CelD/BcsL family acetyltransferase involved in cellulose biosynthesis
LRRKLRNLAAQGDVRLTRVSEAQSGALERFYQLERSGWKGREGTAIACSPVTRQFYDEIAVEAERFGYLTLYFLELNGRAIAGQFGVTYGGRYFMPKLAHDEQFDQYSPGHLLVDAILRDCAERGVTEYDYLGPDHEWKLRWTNTVRPHTSFFVYRNAAYARALWAARFRVLPAIKRLMGKRHAA